jgi:hypothetical protein
MHKGGIMITFKREDDGEVVYFQIDDGITADGLLGEFRLFMLARGYAPISVKEAIEEHAHIDNN